GISIATADGVLILGGARSLLLDVAQVPITLGDDSLYGRRLRIGTGGEDGPYLADLIVAGDELGGTLPYPQVEHSDEVPHEDFVHIFSGSESRGQRLRRQKERPRKARVSIQGGSSAWPGTATVHLARHK